MTVYKILWLFFAGSFSGWVLETVMAALKWGNGLWLRVFYLIPGSLGRVIVWILATSMLVDILATVIILSGKKRKTENWEKIDFWFAEVSRRLGHRLYCLVNQRIENAYPKKLEKKAAVRKEKGFAYGCSFYKTIWLFLIGAFLGDLTETVFWDYSEIPFNLGGRINLLYCFFWGIAAVVWFKGIYPVVSSWIEKIPSRSGTILTWVMILFMGCNIVVSCMALIRKDERSRGVEARFCWQEQMDERFDDERLARIYPNALKVDKAE